MQWLLSLGQKKRVVNPSDCACEYKAKTAPSVRKSKQSSKNKGENEKA